MKWNDAWVDHTEILPDDFVPDCPMETVGWLLRDGEVVSVAAEKSRSAHYRYVTHIPAGVVSSIEVV